MCHTTDLSKASSVTAAIVSNADAFKIIVLYNVIIPFLTFHPYLRIEKVYRDLSATS